MQIDLSIRFNEMESKEVASLLRLFQMQSPAPTADPSMTSSVSVARLSPFEEFLASPSFRAERDVLGRFKRILSWLHDDNPDDFETMVEEYLERTSGRICLGRSESQVNDSGTNVKAQQIPGTRYWVETNSDTAKKKRHLAEWIVGLARETGEREIELAALALGESKPRS